MSYFLEDTFSTSSAGVLTDYTGMNESMFNAEIAWANINESAMKNEYMAIKNESSEMLQEGISDFFEKIKEWFKNMIQTISRVVSNIKNKILLKSKYYEKYALSALKKFNSAKGKIEKYSGDKKIKFTLLLPNMVEAPVDQMEIYAKTYSANKTLDPSDKEDFMEKVNRTYQSFLSNISKADKTAKEIPVKNALAASIAVCKSMKDVSKNILETIKDFDNASKACKVGIQYADKEDKDKVKELKTTATVINQCSSRYLNMIMKVVSIYKNNISRTLAFVNGNMKADNKFNKEFDKASDKASKIKIDSYYGF